VKNIPLLIVTLLGTLVMVVAVAALFSRSGGAAQTVDQAQLLEGAEHIKGKAEAPITIVEFSDFQCPYCKAIQPLVKSITDQYPDQVKVVYRHFPLVSIHTYATLAAQAAEAAGKQGKFWEMHDLLFQRQEDWVKLTSLEDVEAQFVKYAEELQIDKQAFAVTIQSDEVKQKVARDAALAATLKLDSTPTLFVNGEKVAAPQQLPSLIESKLSTP
jgi:protein-disulfide isomerase